MQVIDPTTEAVTVIEETPREEIRNLFTRAAAVRPQWSKAGVARRIAMIDSFLRTLAQHTDELVALIASEMGKPFQLGRREMERTFEEMSYYTAHAEEWLHPEPCPGGTVHFDPVGMVAVISPWNFPIMLPLRGIVPALLAGNGVIFKPSELTPRSGIAIAKYLKESLGEFTEVFQIVVGGKDHGKVVVDLDVSVIAFTGSTAVGKWIAMQSASTLKRVLLELGGLDPAIVLPDAPVQETAEAIVRANCANSGQVCNAIKRVFVHSSLYEPFVAAAKNVSSNLVIDNPEKSPDLGPIVSATQLSRITDFLADATSKGATVVTGGRRLDRKGFFLPHTVLRDVPPSAALLSEEPFGPVLPVMPYDSEEEAITRANETKFGLTASVWGKDRAAAERIASEIVAGTVSINSHVAGQPGSPWGGTKESGIGRMKTKDGMREFTNVKLVK